MVEKHDVYDVFVSYSRADHLHAAEIDSSLRSAGLATFFDRRNLDPGLPWVRALEQAICKCRAVVVLIGPNGFGNTQQYERDLAFFRQTREPNVPVVPVILPGANTELPFNFLQLLTWIDFSKVARPSDAPEELGRLVAAARGAQAGSDTARSEICPYRGLDAFCEADSAFFVGRGSADRPDTAVGELVRKVREHSFVIVVGRSGSGKSSLVFAGLIPALRREPNYFWNVMSLRPGADPLRALATVFNPRIENEGAAEYAKRIGNEANELRTGDPSLLGHMICDDLARTADKPDRLLLYIDQWEELYAQETSRAADESGTLDPKQTRHDEDVSRFITLLLNAAHAAPVSIVATVRADFYGSLLAHDEISKLLRSRQVTLGPMSRDDLEKTIVVPAKMVGLAFDPPKLVQRILDDVAEDEGMLPLLQYALKETWQTRDRSRNCLTSYAYTESGGVKDAIQKTADRAFDGLSPSDQLAAKRVFLRLVTPGREQEDLRARAAMPTDPLLRNVVEQFANPRVRLLVTGWDRAGRPTVEVGHEALIRSWPRLREWINTNNTRANLRTRASVLQYKTEWEEEGRRDDLLLPAGFQLARALELLANPGDVPIDDIQDFIELSSSRNATWRWSRAWTRRNVLLLAGATMISGGVGFAIRESQRQLGDAPEPGIPPESPAPTGSTFRTEPFSLTWLADVLKNVGLTVAEVDGWQHRGHAEMDKVLGVMCHHTAGPRDGNMPTLDLLTNGRSDLLGPLAHLGLGRDGTFYVIAAGRASHAGEGMWQGIGTGNSNFIGIQAENSGLSDDPWPQVQMRAYQQGVAAILKKIGAKPIMCCGHKEYALPQGRKTDPSFDMSEFRNQVTRIMAGAAPEPVK